MKTYKEGDWIIDKNGRQFNVAFKLDKLTTLWYSGHDYATPAEVEYAVKMNIFFDIHSIYTSAVKESFRINDSLLPKNKLEIVTNNLLKLGDDFKAYKKDLDDVYGDYEKRELTKISYKSQDKIKPVIVKSNREPFVISKDVSPDDKIYLTPLDNPGRRIHQVMELWYDAVTVATSMGCSTKPYEYFTLVTPEELVNAAIHVIHSYNGQIEDNRNR